MTDDQLPYRRVPQESYHFQLLPLDTEHPAYRTEYKTAKAIFSTRPGEIQIPYVAREEKGDFSGLMDRLVSDLGCTSVRFLGVTEPEDEEWIELWENVTPEGSVPLYKVLHGFEFEEIEWEMEDGETQPCKTLVGEWSP